MRGVLVLFFAVLVLAACSAPAERPRGDAWLEPPAGAAERLLPTEFTPPLEAPDFRLVDHDGRAFRLAGQRGRLVLLFFGYTSCPDVCPATIANLRRALTMLGKRGEHARVIMVTVDPERDTPARLAGYLRSAAGGDGRFVGLTGPRRDLQAVWADYGVFVEREPVGEGGGYAVSHTASTFVIDPAGRLVATYPFGLAARAMAADLRRRL